MKLYQKLRFENERNADNLLKIEEAAAKAIDIMIQYAEVAISESNLNEEGFLRFTYPLEDGSGFTNVAPKINLHDESELQDIFDEQFANLVRFEYSELL
jgi:hypothetical protein